MPNHVENELACAKHVLDFLKGTPTEDSDNAIDFNKIIPMPPGLDEECGMHIDDWAKLAIGHYDLSYFQRQHTPPSQSAAKGDWGAAANALHVSNVLTLLDKGPYPKDFDAKEWASFLNRIKCLKETGFVSWYEWSIKNWGTKWNAYQTRRVSDTAVRFQTAWSAPLPVVDAVSRKFPDEVLRLSWADEDYGNNAGRVMVQNGNIIQGGRVENESQEAYALVLDLHCNGVVPDDMEMINGKLQYKPETADA